MTKKKKRPYVRQWYHDPEGGDDTYAQKPATKALIAKAVEARKKGYDVVVATTGRIFTSREYPPQAYLNKHPEWKLKKEKKKAPKPKKAKKKTIKKKCKVHKGPRGGKYIMVRKRGGGTRRQYIK